MAGKTQVPRTTRSPFVDPFFADLEAFTATFCDRADPSIPSTSNTRQVSTGSSFAKALAANATNNAIIVKHEASPALPEMAEAPARTRLRDKLTKAEAISIFKMKRNKTSKTAARLAAKYRITPKTVRDIWTQSTWIVATKPFWNRDETENAITARMSSSAPAPAAVITTTKIASTWLPGPIARSTKW